MLSSYVLIRICMYVVQFVLESQGQWFSMRLLGQFLMFITIEHTFLFCVEPCYDTFMLSISFCRIQFNFRFQLHFFIFSFSFLLRKINCTKCVVIMYLDISGSTIPPIYNPTIPNNTVFRYKL